MERREGNQQQFNTVEKISPKEERVIFDTRWNERRRQNRLDNLKLATGWIHTGSGVTYLERGNGGRQPRPRKI